MGLTVQSAVINGQFPGFWLPKQRTHELASSLLYEGQRLKVSSPRSESGGDYPPITLPMHPGEATSLPRALYGTRNPEPGTWNLEEGLRAQKSGIRAGRDLRSEALVLRASWFDGSASPCAWSPGRSPRRLRNRISM